MLNNNDIKAALIAYAKSKPALTAALGGSDEIRESQWQGETFDYPCVRVKILDNVPINDCDMSRVEVSFMVFSEGYSSDESDEIAGIIKDIFINTGFVSNGIPFTSSITRLISPIRQDARTWRTEAIFSMIVSG